MKVKKFSAILAAAVLGAASMPTGAMAAESYHAAEKAAFAEWVGKTTADYAKDLEEYNKVKEDKIKASVDFSLKLDDTGKALAGMFVPLDISWFSDANMVARVSYGEGQDIIESIELLVNGTKICTVDYYMDMEGLNYYIRIPELSDGVIKMDMTALEDSSTGEAIDPDEFKEMMGLASSMTEYLPEASVMEGLLDKYGNMILDGIAEGEAGSDTLSVSGIEQECTTFTGTVKQEEALGILNNVLNTAKEDEELKALLEKWSELAPEEENLYKQFQDGIDSLLEETNDDTVAVNADDTSYIESKIWLDGEDHIVGRQFSFVNEEGADPVITWQEPVNGDTNALLVSLESEDSTIVFTGSGTVTDGMLTGNYLFSVDGADMVNIDVKDYDTNAAAEGNTVGTYEFSLLPGAAGGDEEAYNILSGFMATAVISGDQQNASITLNLSSSGSSLGTLGFAASTGGEEFEGLDPNSMESIYDVMNEEDMNAYGGTITMDTVLDNLMAAGMPETFIDDVMSLMTSTGETGAEEVYEGEEESDTLGE